MATNAPKSKKSTVAFLPGQLAGGTRTTEGSGSGRSFIVEFDDALMDLGGWKNPRWEGSKLTSLYKNRFSPAGTPKIPGGLTHPNVDNLVDITQSWGGDNNYDEDPLIESNTTSIFFGTSIAGYNEDPRYPNVGPDFSYLFISKIYTFNTEDDDYFVTELLGPDDDVFERVLKQDMKWADKFQIKILDPGVGHDLRDEYNVHYNRGLFSKILTYATCSEEPFSHPQLVSTQYTPYAGDDYYGIPITPFEDTTNYDIGIRRYHVMTQNQIHFAYNRDQLDYVTGSITVEKNPDTWWWRRPQSSSFFKGTTMANYYRGATDLQVLTDVADATASLYNFLHRLMIMSGSQGQEQLHIVTFNEAENCTREFQTEQRYGRNITQALRHFGSVSLSPGRLLGIPNVPMDQKPTLHETNVGTKIVSPSFNQFTTHSYQYTSTQTHSIYTWFNNNNAESFYVTTAGSNNGADVTQSRAEASGSLEAPTLNTWTISKFEPRLNVIMTDLNKQEEMFEGVGKRGFVLIHEDLHPTIKNNIDFYLKKAELLVDGPLKKPMRPKRPRIIRKKLKRRGRWFQKLGGGILGNFYKKFLPPWLRNKFRR